MPIRASSLLRQYGFLCRWLMALPKQWNCREKNVDELSEILHHSFDAILYVDQQGIIRLCNVAAEAILHLRGTNIQGVPLWEFIPALSETEVQAVLDGEEMIGHLVDISGRTYVLNGAKLEFASQIHGASFYFKELSKIETMERHIRNEMVSKGQTAQFSFQDIIGDSPAILTAKQTAERFARHDSTVLLLGETGTGKELFAQSIHNASRRRHHPFVAVNCAALSPTLLESELFGYVEGAFTGAMRKGKRGLFEVADGGTIFWMRFQRWTTAGRQNFCVSWPRIALPVWGMTPQGRLMCG